MGKEGAKEEAKEDAKEKVADELKEAALGGDQSLDLKDLEVDEEAPGCRGCSWMPKKRRRKRLQRTAIKATRFQNPTRSYSRRLQRTLTRSKKRKQSKRSRMTLRRRRKEQKKKQKKTQKKKWLT